MNSETHMAATGQAQPSTVFDVFGILWRWRWAIIITTAVVFLAAAGYTMRQTKIYAAEASALVQRQSIANSLNNILSPGAQPSEGPRVLAAQATVARSPEIAERTFKEVPSADLDVNGLLALLTVEPDAASDVLHFKIENESGPLALRLVNVYIKQYVDYATELSRSDAATAMRDVRAEMNRLSRQGRSDSAAYQRLSSNLDQLRSVVALTTPVAQVTNNATSYEKIKPKLLIALVLGVVLGLGLGIGLAFLLEALDPRLRSAESVAALVGLPLLATLPRRAGGDEPVTRKDAGGESAESYRVLLAAAENAAAKPLAGTLLVVSDRDPARATAAVANLGVTSARAGLRTLIVDLGFESPRLTAMFGAAKKPGISNVLSGQERLGSVELNVKTDGEGELSLIPVGTELANTAGLASSEAVKDLLAQLEDENVLVIVDTGTVAGASAAVTAAGVVRRTLLVGSTDSSRPESLEEASRSLRGSGSEVLGAAVCA